MEKTAATVFKILVKLMLILGTISLPNCFAITLLVMIFTLKDTLVIWNSFVLSQIFTDTCKVIVPLTTENHKENF